MTIQPVLTKTPVNNQSQVWEFHPSLVKNGKVFIPQEGERLGHTFHQYCPALQGSDVPQKQDVPGERSETTYVFISNTPQPQEEWEPLPPSVLEKAESMIKVTALQKEIEMFQQEIVQIQSLAKHHPLLTVIQSHIRYLQSLIKEKEDAITEIEYKYSQELSKLGSIGDRSFSRC